MDKCVNKPKIYFKTGLIGKDELILQYLNNYGINYEKVMVASVMAQELKRYIYKLDPNQGI